MESKIEILKKLFIRENENPEFISVLNNYISTPIRKEIGFSGLVNLGYEEQEYYADGFCNDSDGDFIIQSPYSQTLRPRKFEDEVVFISIDPNASPKDVIRLVNKIAKEINDHYKDQIYQRIQKERGQEKKVGNGLYEQQVNSYVVDQDSSYREVMLALLTNLEKYEEKDWVIKKLAKDNLLKRYREEDLRITNELNKPKNEVVNLRIISRPGHHYVDEDTDMPF